MPREDILGAIRKYTDPFRVTKGKTFRLQVLARDQDERPAFALGQRRDVIGFAPPRQARENHSEFTGPA